MRQKAKYQVRVQDEGQASWILAKDLDKKSAEKHVTYHTLGARMQGRKTSYKMEIMSWRNS